MFESLLLTILLGVWSYLFLYVFFYGLNVFKGMEKVEAGRWALIKTHEFIYEMFEFFGRLLVLIIAILIGGFIWYFVRGG